ncbi:ABC transporter substrate-binding protein [Kribbella lupini]|uniref:ABC transporter substrate-binding protein n=1 Tax=Kribbella lupini TaxID=291602 RepID=A0ABP4NFI7_9ACTN
MKSFTRKALISLGGLLATALTLSACGSADPTADTAANTQAPLYNRLPERIQKSGVLKIGGSATVAPYVFKDGNEIVGMDKDLMDALVGVLGVRLEFHDTPYESIITGLKSQRIDVAMGNLSDTRERQAVADLVDYRMVPQSLLVPTGNPKGLTSIDNLCGAVVAGVAGSLSDEQVATEQNGKCKAAGKPGVGFSAFQDATAAILAVQTKRADIMILNGAVATYISNTTKKTEVAGKPFRPRYHAALVLKTNTDIRDALVAAFTELIENGTYAKLLAKWDLAYTAIPAPRVNAGTT